MSTEGASSPGLLEVGSIVKPHGILGETVVVLTTDREERVAPGSVLTGVSERFGAPLELTVTSARRHRDRWIVAFDGWATRDAAEMLRNVRLFAAPLEEPGTLWVHELIGATVVDQAGTERGRVVAVEANPASDILVVDGGTLVPVRFITSFSDGRVTVEVPAGIFPESS